MRRIRWYGRINSRSDDGGNMAENESRANESRAIDVTPTWTDIVGTMLILYRDVESATARDSIVQEFRRMAKAADAYNASATGEK